MTGGFDSGLRHQKPASPNGRATQIAQKEAT